MRYMNFRYRSLGIIFACLLLQGCYFMQSASKPMPAQRFEASAPVAGLLVLLPGFGDGPQQYLEYGFVETVRQTNPAFDVIAVNAHFGYYRNYSVVDRLHEDIIAPLRSRYDEIWLVGISMGGFGAAAYTMTNPEVVDGMILLAPFMGSSDVVEEVMAAGSLGQWVAPELTAIEDDKERRFYELWQFYQGYVETPERKPSLYLGFGDQDHLGGPNSFVADVLTAEHSLVLPGGHKWAVWQPLFAELAYRAIGNKKLAALGRR
jgi:pimeloyl-ACP methyl ester carboxylesterase